jgi:transposase-like protein
MKTQIRKPAAGKMLYAAEYREESVKHWKDSGRSAATVAAELGIRAPLLYRWA